MIFILCAGLAATRCAPAATPCHPVDFACNPGAILLYNNERTARSESYYNGYVAVGDGGTVLLSNDAADWRAVTAFTADRFNSVAAGNGVVVGVTDTGFAWTTRDGENWTSVELDPAGTASFNAAAIRVVFRESTFYVLGGSSYLVSSNDGSDWTLFDSLAGDRISDYAVRPSDGRRVVAFGGSTFTLAHTTGAPQAGSWTQNNQGYFAGRTVVFGGAFHFAEDGTPYMRSTSDLSTFSGQTSALFTGQVTGVATGAGRIVAVGTSNTHGVSSNGSTYSRNFLHLTCSILTTVDVDYENDRFFVFGEDAGAGKICESATGDLGTFLPATVPGGLPAITGVAYSH